MACATRTYELSPEEHAAVLTTISAESLGLQIDPNKGSVTIHGVTLSWSTSDEGKVTFTIGAKPWYVSCEQIYEQLDKLIGKTGE